MNKVVIYHAVGLRAIRMVKYLIALGLGIGVITLVSFVWYLFELDQSKEQLQDYQSRYAKMVTTFNIALGSAQTDFERLVSLPVDHEPSQSFTWDHELRDITEILIADYLNDKVGKQARDLKLVVEDLVQQRQELVQIHLQAKDNRQQRILHYQKVISLLRTLREKVLIYNGKHYLMHAILIRDFRNTTQASKLESVQKVIEHLRDAFPMRGIESEFGELVMLIELLHRSDDLAMLADLKDNRFTASLQRMHMILDRWPDQKLWLEQLNEQLGDLERLLYGKNFKEDYEHQTVTIGQDGMFSENYLKLELIHKRQKTLRRIALNTNKMHHIQSELALRQQRHTDEIWDSFEQDGRNNFLQSSVVMVICWGVFIALALMIHRFIRDQVHTLQETEENLQQQIQERCEAQAESERLYQKLMQSQKLESIGQLAAGIAHEINTPSQYVSDNSIFLKEAFESLKQINELNGLLVDQIKCSGDTCSCVQKIEAKMTELDSNFLWDEIPQAIDQVQDGIRRVSEIVKSMQQFAHPGNGEKIPFDMNKAVQNALTISRNEWKYIAQVKMELAECLPEIPVFPGEVNQVILNMIINASHAIAQRQEGELNHKGWLTLRTQSADGHVQIQIQDNGAGIPQEIQNRIFDPFFTTKPVGKGTGQGLALAYSCVYEKHQGSIEVQSTVGQGTTFTINLPLVDPDHPVQNTVDVIPD